jgi:hypothetical protein
LASWSQQRIWIFHSRSLLIMKTRKCTMYDAFEKFNYEQYSHKQWTFFILLQVNLSHIQVILAARGSSRPFSSLKVLVWICITNVGKCLLSKNKSPNIDHETTFGFTYSTWREPLWFVFVCITQYPGLDLTFRVTFKKGPWIANLSPSKH